MRSLKSDWPLYLTSAATVVPLLSWLAKWLGILANGGSTPVELLAFSLALPGFLRLCIQRLGDQRET